MSESEKESRVILRGVLGGVANALSMLVTNPLDVLKIRFQTSEGILQETGLRSESTFSKAKKIAQAEGISGLWKGTTASVFRELTFSTGRTGLYEPCKALLTPTGANDINGFRKLIAGLLSGAISAAICNPTDVVKIRFQGDPAPIGQPRRYSSLRSAFITIIRTEGFFGGLYRGVATTTARSAVLSGTQLASYDTAKNNILHHYFPQVFPLDSFKLHLLSSFFAGFMTTTTSNPLDIARTRIMNEKIKIIDGKRLPSEYSTNPFITMFIIIRKEGVMALYKGFVPSYIRLGIVTTLFFIIYEGLRSHVGMKGI
jgi:hypothetical protein